MKQGVAVPSSNIWLLRWIELIPHYIQHTLGVPSHCSMIEDGGGHGSPNLELMVW